MVGNWFLCSGGLDRRVIKIMVISAHRNSSQAGPHGSGTSFSAQCSGKSLYFWICSPAPPVAGDWNVDRFQFQVCHKARGISGWIQRDLKVILILPSPKGGCACDSSVSASKGKSCSLLPWKGCWGALLMSPGLMDAQTQHTSHSKHFWSSIFPGRSQAGQSLCVLQTGQM